MTSPRLSTSLGGMLCGFLILASLLFAPIAPAHAAAITYSDPATGLRYSADDANPVAGATVTGYNEALGANPVIPSSITINGVIYDVTTIRNRAFALKNLDSVVIPESITTIGEDAFASNHLTNVEIPDSVTSLGASAFENNDLTSIKIPAGVTTIEPETFYDNNLVSLEIPGTVTTIKNLAFAQNRLESVTIEDGVTTIGNHVFRINALTNIEIPGSVTSIGNGAFAASPGLSRVHFTGDAPTTFTALSGTSGSLGTGPQTTVSFLCGVQGFTTPIWESYPVLPPPCIVTFDPNNGAAADAVAFTYDSLVEAPARPPTREGYSFTGWYTDPGATMSYDFVDPVTRAFTLYAGWEAVDESSPPVDEPRPPIVDPEDNPTKPTPEPTPTTPTPATPPTSVGTSTPQQPAGSALATTGAPDATLFAAIAGVIALTGVVLMVRRRVR